MNSTLTKKQVKKFGPRRRSALDREYGTDAIMTVEVRYDDECGNGHNTFAITADITTKESRRMHDIAAGGCMHDDIAKHFPELSHLIKWHLCSSDGPMHYIGNTMYFAGDRDHNGLKKDEFRPFFDKEGKEVWRIVIPSEYHSFGKLAHVHGDKPAPITLEYERFGTLGEGKERELNKARSAAIWPDATDEELTAPGLKERLEARLPKLLDDFRIAVESLGFTF